MITKLKMAEHSVRRGTDVVEVYQGNNLIAQITPCGPDTALPGVRVITKHVMKVTADFMVTQVEIIPQTSGRSVIENIPRTKLITILNMMPEEAFGWFVQWAKGGMITFPDGLGGFQEESQNSIRALKAAATEYVEKQK